MNYSGPQKRENSQRYVLYETISSKVDHKVRKMIEEKNRSKWYDRAQWADLRNFTLRKLQQLYGGRLLYRHTIALLSKFSFLGIPS